MFANKYFLKLTIQQGYSSVICKVNDVFIDRKMSL